MEEIKSHGKEKTETKSVQSGLSAVIKKKKCGWNVAESRHAGKHVKPPRWRTGREENTKRTAKSTTMARGCSYLPRGQVRDTAGSGDITGRNERGSVFQNQKVLGKKGRDLKLSIKHWSSKLPYLRMALDGVKKNGETHDPDGPRVLSTQNT